MADYFVRRPQVGEIVHYVSYGTPGGEYGKECRAAIVTQRGDARDTVGLAVLNPTGMFFNPDVAYDEGDGQPGQPDCAAQTSHGAPFRYCACGWTESALVGGTWHWPEPQPSEPVRSAH